MALKYFTNAFKGNATDSIAVNPDAVITVYESVQTNHETNEIGSVTTIYVGTTSIQVEEDLLTVIARLNEKD